ncbi:AI-2E family transporter [Zymomonas mobilis subsp. mobilis ZM4 = ATCC 31821]|uniref:PurR-regulated permease PerM n=2 Tax=Zymomonas mobilis TaxID=542 RepID=Q5NPT3_ZYMMO|nr:AI-2E family transporter [Zymomonas mobilis]AAV89277.2 protein of unknown function UPF0118 [Zymomonas mobilis subsp. mobilis ZM4 = ATCC 31821]ACV75161.1 protein of unknown function UPF0118 [Zymomonas mobilis subsp. mobilis NCIMB 11163]AFN56523.1 protein of unknown function UPF0118 [Zymomonas mobilis subsp. mobilis ATCC 29191]AHB09949.1 putative permease [Zymomonas mobilis subsp. mobilis str. CP4 = NRRL B-14023]AHJ70254.1 inner membrane protein ydiK (UPF0118) [Zymomonas mobilis subsp. mobili
MASRPQYTFRFIFFAGIIGLGLWTIRHFWPALIWSIVIAIAFWPLWLKLKESMGSKHEKMLAPALATLAIGVTLILPLLFFAFEIMNDFQAAIHFFQDLKNQDTAPPDWLGRIPFFGGNLVNKWHQFFAPSSDGSQISLHQLLNGNVINHSRAFGMNVARRITTFFFTLMSLFFLFRSGSELQKMFLNVSRRLMGPDMERFAHQVVLSVRGTLDGLVLVGLGEGVLLGIIYVFTGTPHAVMFGGMTAIAAIIPFCAPVMFCIVAAILASQGHIGAAITVVALGMLILMIADHVVRPILIGGATRLPFLWVLIGILGGIETFGLLGLFLGPALMAVLIMIWRDIADPPHLNED